MSPVEAIINDPREPRVFILSGDGTGKELLRPSDVESYRRMVAAKDPHAVRVIETGAP